MPTQLISRETQKVHLVTEKEPETVCVSLEDEPLVMSKFRAEIKNLERVLRKKFPEVRSVCVEQQSRVFKNPHVPGALPISPGHLMLVVAYASYKAGRIAERLSKGAKGFMQGASEAAGKKVGDDLGDKINAFVNLWLDDRYKHLRKEYEARISKKRRKQRR